MRFARVAAIAAGVALLAVSLTACTGVSPRVVDGTKVSIAVSAPLTSLNDRTSFGNRPTNAAVHAMTSSQFARYDDSMVLRRDESFGTMQANEGENFTVDYSVNSGVAWSDGVPVDQADLLLAWVANSGAFNTPDFNDDDFIDPSTGGYSDDFPEDVVYFDGQLNSGLAGALTVPTLGGNGRSMTLAYDKYFADWELALEPGVPAHVLGRIALGVKDPEKAKAAVIEAVVSNDTKALAAISRAWNSAFNLTAMPKDRGLLVSNGPYVIKNIVEGERVILTANPRYTGDKQPLFETVDLVFLSDPLASVQALAGGVVDVIVPQVSADVQDALLGLDNHITVLTGFDSAYEHLDLQFAESKNGHFDDPRVRRAFLEVVPRQQIVDELIVPMQRDAVVRSSHTIIPGAPAYAEAIKVNGSKDFAETNVADAKLLLADAGVVNPEVCILFSSANPRRVQEFQLIQTAAAAAGFVVTDCSVPDIVPVLGTPGAYDAALFGWTPTNLSVSAVVETFHTDGMNNLSKFSDEKVDALLEKLQKETDPAARDDILIAVDKLIWAANFGVPLFQQPAITAHNDRVTGVSRSPLPPGIFWDVWEWKPADGQK